MGSKVSNSQAKKAQILLRAASLSSRPEGIRCGRVTELMRDAVAAGRVSKLKVSGLHTATRKGKNIGKLIFQRWFQSSRWLTFCRYIWQ
jgi:hypothetical protein